MARILITGGSGSFGRALTPRLVKAGNIVRIMSRSARKHEQPGVEWATADIATGGGLAEAVADVDVIVHAASDPVHAKEVDVGGAQRLLALAQGSNVKHFVYISIVGVDRIPFAYYQQKLAAEQVIQQGAVPWTILRATQFHSFIDRLLQPFNQASWLPFLLIPTDFQSQPIDDGEVAEHFAQAILAGPSGRLPDIGGPEVLTLGAMAHAWLAAQNQSRPVWRLPLFGKVAAGFRNGDNTIPAVRTGKITWSQWLARKFDERRQSSVVNGQSSVIKQGG